ncbi:hypothetical protein [Nocardia brasiliensis]|uniref:Outer membrane channel protein CpnT-like N-terminal domain-containing protein n=1 Tax=Nocardia brasiliensis (strain ATCC 700358 / HUJEG-1) TaxID=1133849 RepID=K0EZL5_NOCB7|nr:hypothetical protein [Nocardia brasiliensis]AFU05413.1 hypothetical protein O3I_037330 [Nocardia brasiliensis ATCC 700358]OCF87893.1 hypothetical protein AW168_22810 [Nocardia brasiliensis]
MSITLPSELHWLGWVAGSDWPDGDEDKMWAIAADWRGAAREIRRLLPDLASAEHATIRAYPWGEGIEAMTAALGELAHGPESLEQLADILEQVAESADALGAEIEYTKILVISSLAMLAFEIAAAWVFPPTAPLVEAAAIGVTRLAVRLLGQRAVSAIARFAAKTGLAALAKFSAKHIVFSTVLGAGQDLAIQGYQVGAGHRKDIDWNRVGTTAYTAAAAGAVGGPAGGLLGKAAGKVPGGRITNGLKGAAVGAGAGMIGAVGAWGVGGIANGWTWDPRMLTGGAAYGVLVGGSKGIRHSSAGRGPGATNFRGPERGVFGRDGGAVSRLGDGGDGSAARPGAGSDGSPPRPAAADRSRPSVGGEGGSTRSNGGSTGATVRTGAGDVGSVGATAGGDGSSVRSGFGGDGSTARPGMADGGGAGRQGGVQETHAGAAPVGAVDSRAVSGSTEHQAQSDSPRSFPSDEARSRSIAASAPEPGSPRAGAPETAASQSDSRSGAHPAQSEAGQNIVAGPKNGAESQSGAPEIRTAREEQAQSAGEQRGASDVNRAGEPRSAQSGEPTDSRGAQAVPGEQTPDRGHTPKRAMSDGGEVGAGQGASSEVGHGSSGTEKVGGAEVPDSVRAQLRELGVDPEGMSPEQMRGAANDAFARRMGVFVDRTLALEGAGLRPSELMVQRRELQTQINEFMQQRRELHAELDRYRSAAAPSAAPQTPPNHAATPSTTPQPTPNHAARPHPTSPPPDTRLHAQAATEPADTTSKIPYTPRYFAVPPIPEFTAATPPDDSIWNAPNPHPEPTPTPKPTPPTPAPAPAATPEPAHAPTPAPAPTPASEAEPARTPAPTPEPPLAPAPMPTPEACPDAEPTPTLVPELHPGHVPLPMPAPESHLNVEPTPPTLAPSPTFVGNPQPTPTPVPEPHLECEPPPSVLGPALEPRLELLPESESMPPTLAPNPDPASSSCQDSG